MGSPREAARRDFTPCRPAERAVRLLGTHMICCTRRRGAGTRVLRMSSVVRLSNVRCRSLSGIKKRVKPRERQSTDDTPRPGSPARAALPRPRRVPLPAAARSRRARYQSVRRSNNYDKAVRDTRFIIIDRGTTQNKRASLAIIPIALGARGFRSRVPYNPSLFAPVSPARRPTKRPCLREQEMCPRRWLLLRS